MLMNLAVTNGLASDKLVCHHSGRHLFKLLDINLNGDTRSLLPVRSMVYFFSRVFWGTTDSAVFEDFIEQLIHHCRPYPEPNSVLVMDNASFHHTDKIEQMCAKAGVRLLYLPPYSPDLNPIEEFFAELNAFIKKQWHEYEDNPHQDFKVFLDWCIGVVGGRLDSAEGHFRHAGVTVEAIGNVSLIDKASSI